MTDMDTTAAQQLEEMGPIDYIVIEWPGRQPTGEALPSILDLVDRGIIRVLDLAFIAKDENGSIYALETSAAVLIWENRWAAPVAVALRKSGAQLVASGRIPVQAIIAALDETEPTT